MSVLRMAVLLLEKDSTRPWQLPLARQRWTSWTLCLTSAPSGSWAIWSDGLSVWDGTQFYQIIISMVEGGSFFGALENNILPQITSCSYETSALLGGCWDLGTAGGWRASHPTPELQKTSLIGAWEPSKQPLGRGSVFFATRKVTLNLWRSFLSGSAG